MRVVSWNVNGIRACVRHGFVGFVDRYVAADRNARNLLDEPFRQRSTRQLADLQVLTHQRESGGGDVLPKIAEGHQVAEVVGLRLTPLRLSQEGRFTYRRTKRARRVAGKPPAQPEGQPTPEDQIRWNREPQPRKVDPGRRQIGHRFEKQSPARRA